MYNFLIKGIILFFIVMSSSGFSATSGTLLLQGIVVEELSLTVNPEAIANTLDLSVTQTDLQVATISESSNSNNGYKISLSSVNDGDLVRSGGSETFSYTLKYDGVGVNLVGSSTTPITAKTQLTGGVYTVSSNVQISYTGVPASNMTAGTYQDTITFEIAAN